MSIAARVLDFSLPATDGQTYGLTDVAGENGTALIFTCNHCPFVRAWDDRLVALWAASSWGKASGSARLAPTILPNILPTISRICRSGHRSWGCPTRICTTNRRTWRGLTGPSARRRFSCSTARATLRYHGTIDDSYEDESAVQSTYFRDALAAVVAGDDVPVADTAPVGCTIKWK